MSWLAAVCCNARVPAVLTRRALTPCRRALATRAPDKPITVMSNPPPGAHSGAVVPTRLAAVRADWTAAASADVTQRVSSQSLAAVAVELGEGQAKLSSPSSLNAIPRTVVVQQQPPRPHHVDTTDGSSTDSGVAAPTPSHSVVASASLVLPTTGQADADHSTAVPIASGAAAQPASRGDLPLNARRADHRVLTVSTGTTPVQPSTPHHAYMLSSPRSTQTEREEDPRITLRPWTLQYMMDGKPHAKLQVRRVRVHCYRRRRRHRLHGHHHCRLLLLLLPAPCSSHKRSPLPPNRAPLCAKMRGDTSCLCVGVPWRL